MTIGIYSLYWEKPDLIYIGQSQNIEERLRQHLNLMKRGAHYNYKIQNAHDKYGLPSFSILEICNIDSLLENEKYWCYEFDALNNLTGLNISEPGELGSGIGTNHGSSKYSKITVLRVFSLLYRTGLPYRSISEKTSTDIRLAGHIKNGISHVWLKEKYPEQYNLMQNRSKTRYIPFIGSKHKHSKITILRVFSLLYRTSLSYKQIAIKTHTNKKLVSHIKVGDRHIWLQTDYPNKFASIQLNRAK